jgi:hypothetical protein
MRKLILVLLILSVAACSVQRKDEGKPTSSEAQPQMSEEKPGGGAIEVRSTPAGAAIILLAEEGGQPEPRGSTPTVITGLAPGKYIIHLEKLGYRFFQKKVEIKQNETVRVDAKLKKE